MALHHFMLTSIQNADHVLVICNNVMARKFSTGLTGVMYEYLAYIDICKTQKELTDRYVVPVCLTDKAIDIPGLAGIFSAVSVYKDGYANALFQLIIKLLGFKLFQINTLLKEAKDSIVKLESLGCTCFTRKAVALRYENSYAPSTAFVMLQDKPNISHFKIPHSNAIFVGREQELDKITQSIEQQKIQQKNLAGVVLHGLSGNGKTTLAIEWQERYGRYYDLIAWFNAENIDELVKDYLSLGKALNLIESEEVSQSNLESFNERLVKKTQHWKCLFIYDNIISYANIGKYIPAKGIHLIITTQQNPMLDFGELLVDSMINKDAIQLIKAIQEKHSQVVIDNDNDRNKLTTILGGHTLTIVQASSYMKENSCSSDEYLKQFSQLENKRFLLDEKLSFKSLEPNYKTTYQTFCFSILKIKVTDEKAFNILLQLAYLDSINIPETMLQQFFANRSVIQRNQALTLLANYSLVKRQNGEVSIHRLLQEVIRIWILQTETGKPLDYLFTMLHMLNQEYTQAKDLYKSKQLSIKQNLVPHILKICEHLIEIDFDNTDQYIAEITQLRGFANDILYQLLDASSAAILYERIVIIEERLQYHITSIADVRFNLGLAYSSAANYEKAIENLQFSIQVCHNHNNELQEKWIQASLAKTYLEQGNFTKALGLFHNALEYYEQSYRQLISKNIDPKIDPSYHSELCRHHYNIYWMYTHSARAYHLLARYKEALEFYKKAYDWSKEKQIGDTTWLHLPYAQVIVTYYGYDQLQFATTLIDNVVTLFNESYKTDQHPKTVLCQMAYANVYVKYNLSKAIDHVVQALAIYKIALEKLPALTTEQIDITHTKTIADICYCLGKCYLVKENYLLVMQYTHQAIEFLTQTESEKKHINFIKLYYQLGFAYQQLNKINDALKFYKQAQYLINYLYPEYSKFFKEELECHL